MENKIELKTVGDLLGLKFFIPSYQRGYRWTEQQVKDLLNDVNEFEPQELPDSKEKTWYCLQPLVVRKMEENDSRLEGCKDKNNWYEVIDGQQRLTTIYIILKEMNASNDFPDIQYQTRPQSGQFLANIKDETNDSNIDFHFMLSTRDEVAKSKVATDFVSKLLDSCRVIWYETPENAYEVFKRLNSGKISLSNAELVKALLLKDNNFSGMNADAMRLKRLEMAGEWDRMEQTLHDNSFWFFINPEPEDARFNCTRIDFLLEMILRCEKKEDVYLYDIEKELRQNDYFIFSTYSNLIVKEGWEKQWYKIQRFFRIMKAWYDDRKLYHYIGYLMNLKGKDKMVMLQELLCEASKPKDEFLSSLIKRCQQTLGISNGSQEVNFASWEYGKKDGNDRIHNVLLLFNLATTQNQISEMSRYPFDKHFENAKKKWSLEHIHAQNETKANWDKMQFAKIKEYLENITVDGINELKRFLKDKETSEYIDDATYKAIMGAFMGKPVQKHDDGKAITFTSDFEKDDHLTNMALLQGDKNAAFNNKLYPEKRAKLAEYENVEDESLFVPICTRNVFFKHYSPNSMNPLLWDEKAGIEYVTAIVKVVASYLDLNALVPTKENEYKYGVECKKEK